MKWIHAFILITLKIISCMSGTIECGNNVRVYVTTQPQNLTSPLFPNNYPRPASCKWVLKAAKNSRVHFRVDTFSLVPSIFCYLDSFKVNDGSHRLSTQIFNWCGIKNRGVGFKTSGREAFISFSAASEGSETNGFRIEFWSQKIEKPQEREPKLTTANYILIALFGLTVTALFISATCLVTRKCSECKHYQKRNKIFCGSQS